MKVILTPNSDQLQQLRNCIDAAKNVITNYNQGLANTALLKDSLYQIIDKCPNVAYLDPDVLSCYDIDSDDSKWVESDDYETKQNAASLKEIVNEIEEFQSCQLSFASSGSILRTIFGDAYDEVERL